MKKNLAAIKDFPLQVVGSTKFGRYPKISVEQTFNMIISDGFLVPYAGYTAIGEMVPGEVQGRGIFNSVKFKHMIAVANNGVFIIDSNLAISRIGSIDTFEGDVFIDENDANQIGICDKSNIYIFDYIANTFEKITTDFIPGYISFQNGYFLSVALDTSEWRLSAINDGTSWPGGANNVGEFQTKSDNPLAIVRFPGRGNNIFIFGQIVTEQWSNPPGAQLFPYIKNIAFNIDYGTINPATVAAGDNFIIWLGISEKMGAVIMYSNGGDPTQLENDGINFVLSQLKNPSNSYGFLFKQDGHLFYQLTFPDPQDNLSFVYDFTTQSFYTVTDHQMNYHIAKRVAFFNDAYYFVSFNDGLLYKMSSEILDYNGEEIPRIRITPTFRLPDTTPFINQNISFLLEQGESADDQRVDLTVSRDGGVNFGNTVVMDLQPLGVRKNRVVYWNLGYANEITYQFRFWGRTRFVVGNGVMGIYQ